MAEKDKDLASHEGILSVRSDPEHALVDVEFDPSVLADQQVRELLKEHISNVESGIR